MAGLILVPRPHEEKQKMFIYERSMNDITTIFNKTKDWALVQNAALIGVKVNLGYVGLSWLGNLT